MFMNIFNHVLPPCLLSLNHNQNHERRALLFTATLLRNVSGIFSQPKWVW